jgi:site-specific DNA recombinase
VSEAQVLRDLAAREVPTVSMTDQRALRRNRKPARHSGWNSKTLQQILTHPRTSGHVVYRGEIVRRNVCPPILDEDIRR